MMRMCGQENVFSLVQDVRRKIMQAHCPAKPEIKVECTEAEEEGMHLEKDELMNPCLDYLKYIIFSKPGATFQVFCMAQTPRKETPTISFPTPVCNTSRVSTFHPPFSCSLAFPLFSLQANGTVFHSFSDAKEAFLQGLLSETQLKEGAIRHSFFVV